MRSKQSLFAYDIELYKENSKIPLIIIRRSEFFSVLGCNIITQKRGAFLYGNNDMSGRQIKEIIPFIIISKE